MTQDDVIKLGFTAISIVWAALMGWIMRHSQRLTQVESDVNALSKYVTRDSDRTDARLARIEDKLDRIIEHWGDK